MTTFNKSEAILLASLLEVKIKIYSEYVDNKKVNDNKDLMYLEDLIILREKLRSIING